MKRYRSVCAEVKAIVVFCSDPRFSYAHRKFIEEELGLAEGEYYALSVLGGASMLVNDPDNNEDLEAMLGQIEFVIQEMPGIERIVLINHMGCRRAKRSREEGEDDLRQAGRDVRTELGCPSSVQIELYYAAFAEAGNPESGIVFEPVTANEAVGTGQL